MLLSALVRNGSMLALAGPLRGEVAGIHAAMRELFGRTAPCANRSL